MTHSLHQLLSEHHEAEEQLRRIQMERDGVEIFCLGLVGLIWFVVGLLI